MTKEKVFSIVAIVYFLAGLIFAFAFAIYYKWSGLSFFSPGFFFVVFTWPYQAIGFVNDLLIFGLGGKPI